MTGIVVVVAAAAAAVAVAVVGEVVGENDAEQKDENFGEGVDYDDVVPYGKEARISAVVDDEESSVRDAVDVAVVVEGVEVEVDER